MKNSIDPFSPPSGVGHLKYKLLLWRRYFDMGYGLTGYFKYIIALFGVSSLDIAKTIFFGILYGFACFIIGWIWYRYKFMEIDTEIANRFNIFVGEMREMRGKITHED